MIYMQARYYDPVIGRFYSNDPVGYTLANPVMSFNRYLYVNNNPYKFVEPNGAYLRVGNELDREKVLNWVHENSSDKYEFTYSGDLQKVGVGSGNGSETFTKALDQIIGLGSEKGVSVEISQTDPAGRNMDATYGGGGTTPSGDRIIMSGNGANVEGKYLEGGPFTTMSLAISVSAGETFAHDLVDHASPFLQGKLGTGYKGINTVFKEMKVPKVITRTHH